MDDGIHHVDVPFHTEGKTGMCLYLVNESWFSEADRLEKVDKKKILTHIFGSILIHKVTQNYLPKARETFNVPSILPSFRTYPDRTILCFSSLVVGLWSLVKVIGFLAIQAIAWLSPMLATNSLVSFITITVAVDPQPQPTYKRLQLVTKWN